MNNEEMSRSRKQENSLAYYAADLLEKTQPESWDIRFDDFWCHICPPGHLRRHQGWKLHVSATPGSVKMMLDRVVPVLLGHRCAFKFARSVERVEQLIAARCERECGGKVLTVYPGNDEQFRQLAKELHDVTDGLSGPAVLSDRAYCAGSIVSFRFGGFSAARVLGDSGNYEPMLVTPDGQWVPDERLPWFSPPDWAACPLPGPGFEAGIQDKPADGQPELPGGRYQVREAVRHSYRGGVYRGFDVRTGAPVVIKHARPYVGADQTGRDCRDWLRREGKILDLLGPIGCTPAKRDVLDWNGHVFLVEDELPGQSLRHWFESRTRECGLDGPPAARVGALVQHLVRMVAAVHGMGLGIRDLNPANVLVADDESTVWLVDVEGVSEPGEPDRRYVTPGYTAPEQAGAPAYGPAPSLSADLYSLGATILYLCTGAEPALPEDDAPARPTGQRLSALADLAAAQNSEVAGLVPLIHGLLCDDPARRWSLEEVTRFLETMAPAPRPESPGTSGPGSRTDGRRTAMLDQLIGDGLEYLRATMTLDERHLWPPMMWQSHESDPCNAAAGAAGILAVLTQMAVADPGLCPRPLISTVAHGLAKRLEDVPRILPGLYYGHAGAAWAWHDAARYLGDQEMTARASALLRRAPVRWHRPDITHGLAGTGLAAIHLWQHTGDPKMAAKIQACVDGVMAMAEQDAVGVRWPIAQPNQGVHQGRVSHYGFAHGVAGIGAFLLSAGQALGDHDAIELAVACGETLHKAAVIIEGAAWWPIGEREQEALAGHWCSGSSGVGSFLLRLWSHTEDRVFLDAAKLAAAAVYRERWAYSPVVCHGLAGNGEFLIDMSAITGDDRYLEQAGELAACIASRCAVRRGFMIPPGDTLRDVHTGYHTGLAGVLGFLVRLRYGGTRLWMTDQSACNRAFAPPQHHSREERR